MKDRQTRRGDDQLLMMIRFTFYYSAGTIDLLGQYQSYHLMRESHLRERNQSVGPIVYIFGKTIRTSNHHNEFFGALLHVFKPLGKLYATHFLASLIAKNQSVAWLNEAQYLLTFGLLLLFLAYILGVFYGRYYVYLYRHVMLHPANIIVDSRIETFVEGLAYKYYFSFHSRVCV